MSALKDDGVVFELVPIEERTGYTEDEAYALLAGIGPQTSTVKLPPIVAAANAEHTGAMIALIPSDADLKRLAHDGGELADELHMTLMYLGEAADISDDARAAIENAVRRYATAPITAEAFSVNMFNPGSDDKEMAVVLGIGNDGGPALEQLHSNISSAVNGVGGVQLPEQHVPWVPHVTLAYTDDLQLASQLTDRVGLITFNKIRLAFAEKVTDIPLKAGNPQPSASVAAKTKG